MASLKQQQQQQQLHQQQRAWWVHRRALCVESFSFSHSVPTSHFHFFLLFCLLSVQFGYQQQVTNMTRELP